MADADHVHALEDGDATKFQTWKKDQCIEKLDFNGFQFNSLPNASIAPTPMGRYKTLRNYDFSSADFSGADFRGMQFEHAIFAGASFKNADIRGVRFCKCDFRHSSLDGANFHRAHFENVDFEGVKGAGVWLACRQADRVDSG